ncbi:lipase family protein [Pseudomonas sp. KSR10]|uniref:lipase family protein n=1 Tax=Pseudomonas sp. KSR10 TaxID=2916654 RepID=UPI001EF8FB3D|nr:lipase family protein [Pseudomonas sp. KSR10]MCG6542835.1 lipase family protein [Pseudomonas sp. KSR10]
MNNSSKTGGPLGCPVRGHWVSVRLVDEHGDGKPYAGLVYILHDSQGQKYQGALDSNGFFRIDGIYSGPAVLSFLEDYPGGNKWYEHFLDRKSFRLPLTALQVCAEQSPSGPRNADSSTYLAEERAVLESAHLLRVEVSDLVEAKGHLPDPDPTWQPKPSAMLKHNAGQAAECVGIALTPNCHHVLEVKALRAYSPLLSRNKAFCAINAYHLAVMSTFVYAPFGEPKQPDGAYASSPPPYNRSGSIGHVLREQLARLVKANSFDSARYELLYEEVPYSKRLEIMPYDPARYQAEATKGWANPEDVHFLYDEVTDSQAFIVHNDKLMLISVRGTLGTPDILRDLDARQVPYAEGTGQAHRGFYDSFQAVKVFVQRYLEAFYTGEQTLIICGHSLGGAVALLLAEWLRKNWSRDIQLYTFGAPRAGDRAFVQSAQGLVHHRLVNHNDPIPAVPFTWLDAEWKLASAGTVVLFSSPLLGVTLLLGGLLNLQGDPYEHHGQQRHFVPRKPNGGSEASILWQPDCALIDEQACARYAGAIDLQGDMPKRMAFIEQAFAGAEHSSDSGYSRAMLTTLLRWHASAEEREGVLFTPGEIHDIDMLIQMAEAELNSWQPRDFMEFRRAVRVRHDSRFYNKSDLELRQMYNAGIALARSLSRQQRAALGRAKVRLLNEAGRRLTATNVFGDLIDRDDLPNLVAQWRALDQNQRAEKLAKIKKPLARQYA